MAEAATAVTKTPAAPAKAEPTSLLPPGKEKGGMPPTAPAAVQPAAPSPVQSGAFPDWLPDQFRRVRISDTINKDLVTDKGDPDWPQIAEHMTKSWKDTRDALRQKVAYKGAPPPDEKTGKVAYNFTIPEGVTGFTAEDVAGDELWTAAQEAFAEMDLNQEAVDKIVERYVTIAARDNVYNAENERRMLRLAAYSDDKIAEVSQWWEAFCEPQDFAELQELCFDHRNFLLLAKIRNKILGTRSIVDPAPVVSTGREEWERRVKDPRNRSDPAFARETDEMAKRLFPGR